ncbi:MAG: hypothetical protein GWP13_00195, partial [Planctomycetia bacterium]|nr:hypothetical protein [Planctomycetia bacterium]
NYFIPLDDQMFEESSQQAMLAVQQAVKSQLGETTLKDLVEERDAAI